MFEELVARGIEDWFTGIALQTAVAGALEFLEMVFSRVEVL